MDEYRLGTIAQIQNAHSGLAPPIWDHSKTRIRKRAASFDRVNQIYRISPPWPHKKQSHFKKVSNDNGHQYNDIWTLHVFRKLYIRKCT